MLAKEENEFLTRVGPGSPMGELIRRYWIPALLSSKVSAPNSDPVRVRVAGENFVVWRDQGGRLGAFDEYCMHRGASLALGHCEGDGLRCLYHGWKFATDGRILETPNYKRTGLKEKLTAPVYPVREAGGLIWLYLGPRDKEPPFPHYRFMDAPSEQLPIYHATFDCNFVQMMEGTIDPAHPHMLHQDPDKLGPRYVKTPAPGESRGIPSEGERAYTTAVDAVDFVSDDLAPECEAEDTLFGCHGVAIHDAIANGQPTKYGRVHTWVMPFLAIPNMNSFVFSVPIDDDHTTFFAVLGGPIADPTARQRIVDWQAGPASHYEDGHYRWTEKERWGQDRSLMGESFTGVRGVVPEDLAVCLSMGAIFDRSKENLVPADRMVVRMRRRILQAARDLQQGVEPFHLKSEEAYVIGGEMKLVPDPTKWREVIVPNNEPFRLVTT